MTALRERSILACCCAIAALAPTLGRAGSVERAQAFLAASQLPDGSFGGGPLVDTALALRALDPWSRKDAALFALSELRPDNNEGGLARLASLAGSVYQDDVSVQATRTALLAGPIGLAPGSSGADPLVLAWALRLAATDPADPDLSGAVLTSLASVQRPDGSFGFADNAGDLSVTADIAWGLGELPASPQVSAVSTRAAGWLTSQLASRAALPDADLALLVLGFGELQPAIAAELADELMARQAADGSFDGGDVRATSLCALALRRALPDLVVSPAPVVAQAVTGQRFVARVQVRNLGSSASPGCAMSAMVTDGAGQVVLRSTAQVPPLDANASSIVEVDLGKQGAVGTRTLTAIANDPATFSEEMLENNVAVVPFRVAGPPDLVIAASDIAVVPSPAVTLETVVVTVRVRNVGDADARRVHVQLFDGDPAGGGTLVAEAFLNLVAPGVPRTLTGQIAVRSVDPITLYARADPEDAIVEADEANNSASLTVNPVNLGDITYDLRAALRTPAMPTIQQGDTLSIEYGADMAVSRGGGYPAMPERWTIPGATVVLYRGAAGSQTEIARHHFTNQAMVYGPRSVAYSISTSGWPDGTYQYTVVADPSSELPDVDRTNNVRTCAVSVVTGNVPELWIDGLSASPENVAVSGSVTVRGTLHNTGTVKATSVPVQVRAPDYEATIVVPELAPGGAVALTQTFTAPSSGGSYSYSFNVDPQQTILESSKSNNLAQGQFRVVWVDLEVVGATVSPDPIQANAPATLTVQLKNIGTTTYPWLQANLVAYRGTAQQQQIGSLYTTTYPAPGTTSSYTFPITTSSLLGQVDAHLILLPQGTTAIIPLHTLNPDFSVSGSAISFSPSSPSPGDPVTPRVVVNNTGMLTAPTSVRVYRGYPESKDLASAGTVTVPAGGSAVFEGPGFALPSSPPYVVTVVLDEEAAFAEPNESDNSATRSFIKADGEVVVAFDETHGQLVSPYNPADPVGAGFPDWAHDLAARGYTIRSVDPGNDGFTAAKLLGVDVVVNVLPMSDYTPAEREVWRTFLANGGGLLFLGEWGSDSQPPGWQAAEDDFLSIVGVTNAHVSLGGSVYPTFLRSAPGYGVIHDHPIMTGIQSVEGNLTGGFSHLPDGAQVFLDSGGYGPNGLPVGASFELGKGRVVVLGDTQFFDSALHGCPGGGCAVVVYDLTQNHRFGLQTVDWLVNGGPRDYLPDLAFAPASIDLSNASPVSGEQVVAGVTIRNVGGAIASASSSTVRLYDGDPANGVLLGEESLEDLGIGVDQQVWFAWDTTRAAGDHVLTAVIDEEGAIAELSKDNNSISIPLTVRTSRDLRVDPSDIAPLRDGTATVAVTVHNLGYDGVAAGTRLQLVDSPASGSPAQVSLTLGSVPARGATTVVVPLQAFDPSLQHKLAVTVDADQQLLDPARDDNTATATFSPPVLEIVSPVSGTQWGGQKDVLWSGSSLEKGDVTYFVALSSGGGPFTGLGSTTEQAFSFDTQSFADGDYRARVTASDGFLRTSRETPFTIANAGAALRAFGSGAGTATVTIASGTGASQLAIPVGSRIVSATAAVSPVSAPSPIAVGNIYRIGVFDVNGRLWMFSTEGTASNVLLGYRTSLDDGATWSGLTSIATFGLTSVAASVAHNASGFHVAYSFGVGNAQQYVHSADGSSWSAPVAIPGGILTASDEGLLLLSQTGLATISQGSPDGSSWSPAHPIAGVVNQSGIRATVAGGSLHLVAWDGTALRYYKARSGADVSQQGSLSMAVALDGPIIYDAVLHVADGTLFVAYSTSRTGSGWQIWGQRCELARDCTRRDAWLPAPVLLGVGSGVQLGSIGPDLLAAAWPYGHASWQVNGLEGGKRFSPAFKNGPPELGGPHWLFGEGYVGVVGGGQNYTIMFDRNPGLTPTELMVDIGSDGTPDLSRPGMPGASTQIQDFSTALNAYLATHTDSDDGIVDGFVQVPVTVTSRGAGMTTLRNLEVRYQPLAQLAGFADPPLFSPAASPGVLDTSMLSLLASGPVAVMTADGSLVRTLPTTSAGGRNVATFDGRDDAGAVLSSGLYLFGAPGWPVGSVEIDDVLPTAVLDAGAEGSYGGVAVIRGVATDADYAGTARNFARYVLDYTLDGVTYQPISVGTSPAVNGVLGRWDTRQLPAGSATLRLTVHDRAGNSASTQRGVSVSPGAPAAPVIDSPTVAGAPVDSAVPAITVAGSAEPRTTITVFVNGASVGTAPSDGRWSLAGVRLPAGVATITASASREGLESPRAQPIQVASYALAVAVSAPSHALAGAEVPVTITVGRTSVLATPLTLRVRILDSVGRIAPIDLSPSQQVLALPGQGSASFQVVLSTDRALPASYQVVADVVSGGLVPASGSASLVLDPVQNLIAALASDKAVYDALQVVDLTAQILNAPHGVASGPLTGVITVYEPTGAGAVLGPFPLGSVPPGGSGAQSLLFGAPPLPVGVYLADLAVSDETGTVVATATTSFEVQAAIGTGDLAGTLEVTPATYLPGDVLSAAFSVENHGGDAQVPVAVLLLEQATGAVVARFDAAMGIANGTTASDVAALSTREADGDELIALLVGNGHGLAAQAIAPSPWRDTTPPVIEIERVAEGEYRGGPVTPIITVTDPDSPFTWEAKLDGQAYQSGTEIAAEGDHDLAVEALDVYGNAARASRRFTIDRTPPAIAISGVTDGEMASAPVTPTATFGDLHLRSSSLTLEGQAFASGTTLAADGDYTLVASADDMAGNSASTTVSFTIDQTSPFITITGVADGELTNGTAFPAVQVTETHPASETELLDGAPWDGLPVTSEGDHVLTVRAVDLAGNASEAAVHFTIDRTPPAILVAGVSDEALLNHAVHPTITVTDLHSPAYTATLDGQPFTSGSTVSAEGAHSLVVHAQDAAGNGSELTLRFVIDLTPPAISITGVADGLLTNQVVAPAASATDAHLASLAVTLDGQAFTSGTAVHAEGEHVLQVAAADAAGNTSSVEVRFTQDFTPPAIQLHGVADGGVHHQAVAPTYGASDLHDPSATATLDGALFSSGATIRANGTHVLVVTARDGAGNTATLRATFTVFIVDASLALSVDDDPRVLVALDCEDDRECDHHGSHDDGASRCEAGATVLLEALRSAGIPFDVAHGEDDLERLFRTHRHNVRILYRQDADEDHLEEEIREATWAGGGLVVVKTRPDSDPRLWPALGVAMRGRLRELGTLQITPGELGQARSITIGGRGVEQKLLGATSAGTTHDRKVVLSTHHYGAGRSVAITFDPEANPGSSEVSALLVAAVRFAASGAKPAAVPDAPQFVRLDAQLLSEGPVEFQLVAEPGDALAVVDAPLASSLTPPTWLFQLDTGGSLQRSLSVTAGHPGTFPIRATLDAIYGADLWQVAGSELDVGLSASLADLRARALETLAALPPLSGCDDDDRDLVESLERVNLSPATEHEGEESISRILHVIHKVAGRAGSAEVAARNALDDLLRAVEVTVSRIPER